MATFNDLLTQLRFRYGSETDASVAVAGMDDVGYLLNYRLQECYRFAPWDFLLAIESVEYTDETYRYVDISDGRNVYAVYGLDPREGNPGSPLRTEVIEAGKLRLDGEVPDTVYVSYQPAAPNWITDDPIVDVNDLLAPAAVELAYHDMLEQEMGDEEIRLRRAKAAQSRGYELLNQLAARRSLFQNIPRITVNRHTGARGYYTYSGY